MSSVVLFISELPNEQREITTVLHDYFVEELQLTAKLRYGIPFYYKNSWICYLNPIKNNGVELAFPRGNEMEDPTGLLAADGRKQVRGLHLYQVDEMPFDAIEEILQHAMELDAQKKYASKRSGK